MGCSLWQTYRGEKQMRVAIQEIEKIFHEIEQKHKLKKDTLSEIYKAEARVVFLGRRRNIQPDLRRIVLNASTESGANEN